MHKSYNFIIILCNFYVHLPVQQSKTTNKMHSLVKITTDKKTGNYDVDVILNNVSYDECQSKMADVIEEFYTSDERAGYKLKIGII